MGNKPLGETGGGRGGAGRVGMEKKFGLHDI